MQYLNNIDLVQNELQNAKVQNLATAPLTPVEGQIYFNTTDNNLYVFADGVWEDLTARVDAILSGDTDRIVIGGTPSNPTIDAVTAAIAENGLNLATADQIHTFVTDFGYTTNVGTVTDVTGGDGIVITGDETVTPTINLELIGTPAYPLVGTNAANDVESVDTIGFFDATRGAAGEVAKTTFGEIPIEAVTLIKIYVDTSTAGALNFQGGYDAATNSPVIYPENESITGSVITDATVNVSGTGTLYTTELVVGDSIVANGETRVVETINSDVDLIVSVAFTVTGTEAAPEKIPALITIEKGFMWTVTVGGDFFDEVVGIGDVLISDVDSPTTLAQWTTVQSNIDLATTTTVGIASFSADNFAVSGAGEVTIKDDGVILGTETTGSYVEKVTIATDGLLGAVDAESATADLSLDLGALQAGEGTEFVMSDAGTGSDAYLTPIADAAALINATQSHVATIVSNAVVTHNLGTKDVSVQLYDVTTFDTVFADVDRTTVNTVTIAFGATPTNSIRVLISVVG